MATSNIALSIARWLRKYAVLIIILATLTAEMVSVGLNGMGPRPQLPPNGYISERGLVTLQWNEGNIETPITLQVSRTPEFDSLIIDQPVTGKTYTYRAEMERGTTYYWRLMQNDEPSAVSRFVISKQHVNL